MFIRQVFAIFLKDMRKFWRTPTNVAITVIFPILFVLLMGYTIGSENLGSIRIGVINHDSIPVEINGTDYTDTKFSKEYLEILERNFTISYYDEIGRVQNRNSAMYDMQQNEINAIIVIPENFTECLWLRYTDDAGNMSIPKEGKLALYIDPTDPTAADVTYAAILGSIPVFLSEKYVPAMRHFLKPEFQGSVSFVAHPISPTQKHPPYQRHFERIDYLVPGMMGMIILWVGSKEALNSIVYEKKLGTMERLISSPASSAAVLTGKAITCLVLVFIAVFEVCMTGILAFEVILYWRVLEIFLFVILTGVCSIGLGLFISAVAKDFATAKSLYALFILPIQFFIGAVFPLSVLPEPAQRFGESLPFTKAVEAFQLIMAKNASFSMVQFQLLYVSLWSIGIFAIGIFCYWLYLRSL
ncbi:MAG: ABC transporter permease [Promethearchaeota archaeon]